MKFERGFKFYFLICLILLLPSVCASIGVSPAYYDVDFRPNLKQTFYLNFFSDKGWPLKVYAEGDLTEYAELSTNRLESGSGRVDIILRLPEEIEKPGINYLYIVGEQEDPKLGGFQIIGRIRAPIRVRVPYPGKYAEIDFSTQNAKAGENVPYKLKITSLGKEFIVTNSYIEIYDGFGKKLDTLYLGINALNPTETAEFEGELNTSAYKPGAYKAVAIVEYEQKEAKKEALFKLGELYVAVTDYTREFQKGKINRMEIDVESFWNDPIENLHAEVEILNYSINFLTPSVTLDGFQKTRLTGFFDSAPIQEDSFKAKITLRYGGKTSEKIVELRFKKEIDYKLYLTIAAISVLLIIIIILSVWIIKLERELHERLGKYEKERAGRRGKR